MLTSWHASCAKSCMSCVHDGWSGVAPSARVSACGVTWWASWFLPGCG